MKSVLGVCMGGTNPPYSGGHTRRGCKGDPCVGTGDPLGRPYKDYHHEPEGNYMAQPKPAPRWIDQPAAADSYRSLFKWGDPNGFRHPNSGMYALVKEAL